jgi:hypothetical protein
VEISQSTLIVAALLAGFIVFVTANGNLPKYLGVIGV